MEKRRSARARLPSLKAELNQLVENRVAVLKGTITDSSVQSEPGLGEHDSGTDLQEVSRCHEVDNCSSDSNHNDGSGNGECDCGGHEPGGSGNGSNEEDWSSDKEHGEKSMTAPTGSMIPQCGSWVHYGWLAKQLPGRESQLQLLLTLHGMGESALPPSIYIHGNSGVGKTLTVQTFLSRLQLSHALVNCTECYCSRLLFESVLNRLSRSSLTSKSSYTGFTRCDTIVTFIDQLQQLIDTTDHSPSQPVYIVLDHCDRLRELEPTLLPVLLELSSLCARRVCVIFISHLAYESMFCDAVDFFPVPLFFPDYTKAQLLTIMTLDCPTNQPLPFFKTYVNHIWNVFSHVCRDLSELRHLSSLLFVKYVEPVEQGEIGCHETRRLWYHIQPYFKGVMSHVFLRELSSQQWNKISTDSGMGVASEVRGHLELPHWSKYLLLAAYLASYNPSNTDRKFFSKKSSKVRKSHRQSQKQKPNYQLLGPKMFPLDRLMAIFYSILEEPVSPTVDIYSQVSSLVTLQLLAQVSSQDVLDVPKYKCLVGLEFIRRIARSVSFDIMQYLYDFN